MQTHDLQTLYPQFQSALAAFPDNTIALCLYESRDRVHFHAYPQPAFGFPTSTFPTVLPELRTVFAVQATGVFIRAAIDAATITMLHEIDIGCGYSIRVFDDAAQLASAVSYCQSYAFVRADACLVVWADSVDAVMPIWHDITYCLQSQFGGALLHPNTMPGLSGNLYGIDPLLLPDAFDVHAPQQGAFSQTSTGSLSSLSELSFLETVPLPNTPSSTLEGYQYADPDPATWLWGQNTSPGMGLLQHELQMLNTTSEPSLANDVPSYNFGDMPLTVNLATISPPPVGVYDLSQEEDPKLSASSASSSCGLSLDFTSDGPVSPSSFSQSQSPSAQPNSFTDALSFRRHSVGPSSAPERTVGRKTKREGGDAASHEDNDNHDDVDESHFLAAAAHTSKRRRAAGAIMISKATSAPARFIVPLPTIVEPQPAEAKNDIDDDIDDTSSISSGSQSQAHSLALSTPTSPPAPLAPAPAPARKSRGRSRRTPRTKCEFCPKTFSRMQDAQRHAVASCPDNPSKAGVACPECGEVLSRQDSAQRHWRGHENPKCEPPEWAHSRE